MAEILNAECEVTSIRKTVKSEKDDTGTVVETTTAELVELRGKEGVDAIISVNVRNPDKFGSFPVGDSFTMSLSTVDTAGA